MAIGGAGGTAPDSGLVLAGGRGGGIGAADGALGGRGGAMWDGEASRGGGGGGGGGAPEGMPRLGSAGALGPANGGGTLCLSCGPGGAGGGGGGPPFSSGVFGGLAGGGGACSALAGRS